MPVAGSSPFQDTLIGQAGSARRVRVAALALWLLPMLVVTIMVLINPRHRTVTIDSYHFSASQWWSGRSLYIGPAGMNYLPHFAILFSPFHALPFWLGEVLWRWAGAVAVVFGLWRTIRACLASAPERPFFWATLAAMPLCLSALRNGNANAQFGGVLLLAVAAILERRWALAAAWIALLTALKPLGIVVVLLAPLVYAPLRWRLPVAGVLLLLFPFLFGRPDYVVSQYHESWANLRACAVVTEHRFADINGLFRTFGTPLPPEASQWVRVVAGLAVAVVWVLGARRQREPVVALWLLALTTAYLMLFNPMTEANSYGILAPALGIWAVWLLFPEPGDAPRRGWTLVALALSMGLLPNLVRPLFHNAFALFWHPLMTLVFLGLIAPFVWRPRPPVVGATGADGAASPTAASPGRG